MLTDRTKLSILIIGILLVITVIVLAFFGAFSGRDQAPEPAAEQELPQFEDASIGVEDQVFDSENPGPLETSSEEQAGDLLFRQARDAAEFFVERFGTYTSETMGQNIDDLVGFMTPSMRAWATNWRESQPERDSAFSVGTTTIGSESIDFSPASRGAEFRVFTRRAESGDSGSESYEQPARVLLEQDARGEWQVAGLFWENKE